MAIRLAIGGCVAHKLALKPSPSDACALLDGRGRADGIFDLLQGAGQAERVARQLRARGVGLILARPRHPEREQPRHDWRQDDRDDPEDEEHNASGTAAAAVVAVA
jgi:hypothetical protein